MLFVSYFFVKFWPQLDSTILINKGGSSAQHVKLPLLRTLMVDTWWFPTWTWLTWLAVRRPVRLGRKEPGSKVSTVQGELSIQLSLSLPHSLSSSPSSFLFLLISLSLSLSSYLFLFLSLSSISFFLSLSHTREGLLPEPSWPGWQWEGRLDWDGRNKVVKSRRTN